MIISLFVLFVIIINFSIFLSKEKPKKFGSCIFLTILLLLLLIYLFSIVNLLTFSLYFVYLLSAIVAVFNINYFIKNKLKIRDFLMTPTFFYVCLVLISSIIIFRNNYLFNWDEFSHWGTYAKNVFLNNKLWSPNFSSSASGYPPIISLFQVFVMKICNVYREPLLFSSLFFLNSLALTPIIEKIFNKKWWFVIIISLICILLPSSFVRDYFNTIYVDATLGILFGMLLFYLVSEKQSMLKLLIIFNCGSVLILTKEFGLVLVMIFYALLLIDFLFFRKKEYIEYYKEKHKTICSKILLVLLVLLPLLFRLSWSIYINTIINISGQLGTITKAISVPTYFWNLIKSFMENLYFTIIRSGSSLISLSAVQWGILFLLIIYMIKISFANKKNNKKFDFSYVIICVSLVAYSICLLLSYSFIFSEEEALRFASYHRYMWSILLALFIYLFGLITSIDIKNNKILKRTYIIVLLFVVCTIGYKPIVSVYNNLFTNQQEVEHQKFDNSFSNVYKIKEYIADNDKIYFISSENDGFRYWVAKYILTPSKIQSDGYWSLGNSSYETDIWSHNISLAEFKIRLKNMNYIYLDYINEDFKNKYGTIFSNKEIKNNCLYKINNLENNVIDEFKCF